MIIMYSPTITLTHSCTYIRALSEAHTHTYDSHSFGIAHARMHACMHIQTHSLLLFLSIYGMHSSWLLEGGTGEVTDTTLAAFSTF